MRTPPTLDEIDLGPKKRRIKYRPLLSVWWYVVMAVVGVASVLVGAGVIPISGGRPGTDDTMTMKWLALILGSGLLLLVVIAFAVLTYLGGQRLLVFAGGVCWEWKSRQECYRWKDVRKIVYFSSDPRVYWLHFKNGRKVCVSLLGGVAKSDWLALRRLLEVQVPDKFVEEP